jgi:hypothetical protein
MVNGPAGGTRKRRGARASEQLPLWKKRGGKRRGAGRPPKGARAGAPHKQRPFLDARTPVHVTLRVVDAVGRLRRRSAYQAIREATLVTARSARVRSADRVPAPDVVASRRLEEDRHRLVPRSPIVEAPGIGGAMTLAGV